MGNRTSHTFTTFKHNNRTFYIYGVIYLDRPMDGWHGHVIENGEIFFILQDAYKNVNDLFDKAKERIKEST